MHHHKHAIKHVKCKGLQLGQHQKLAVCHLVVVQISGWKKSWLWVWGRQGGGVPGQGEGEVNAWWGGSRAAPPNLSSTWSWTPCLTAWPRTLILCWFQSYCRLFPLFLLLGIGNENLLFPRRRWWYLVLNGYHSSHFWCRSSHSKLLSILGSPATLLCHSPKPASQY